MGPREEWEVEGVAARLEGGISLLGRDLRSREGNGDGDGASRGTRSGSSTMGCEKTKLEETVQYVLRLKEISRNQKRLHDGAIPEQRRDKMSGTKGTPLFSLKLRSEIPPRNENQHGPPHPVKYQRCERMIKQTFSVPFLASPQESEQTFPRWC